MAGQTTTNQLGWPRWAELLLIALLALLIGNRMTMLVDTVVVPSGIAGEQAGPGGGRLPFPIHKPNPAFSGSSR